MAPTHDNVDKIIIFAVVIFGLQTIFELTPNAMLSPDRDCVYARVGRQRRVYAFYHRLMS